MWSLRLHCKMGAIVSARHISFQLLQLFHSFYSHFCSCFHETIVSFVRSRIVSYQQRNSQGIRALSFYTHSHSALLHPMLLNGSFSLDLSFFVIFAQYLFLLYVGLADCCLPFRCNMHIPCIKTKFNFRFARKEKPYKTANATIPPMESTCIPDLQMWKQRQRGREREREPASERARERKSV